MRAKHGGLAKANGNNMPRGFTWPPSQVMRDAAATCEHGLDDASVAWTRAGREGHIVDAVTIDDGVLGGIAYVPAYGKGPHKLDCQLALALAQIGPTLYAAGVREVRFGSIYRWSNIRVGGKTKAALSRHALGLAMDVVSFIDDAGREAVVARDYRHGDPLLLAIEQAVDASSAFRMVLTPKNDPISHKDHFHLEANPSYAVPVPRS
ncbi:MAG TPA: extensin family protein [Kofleriaceae bacterium]|nr:extensin family protein [Kofleriaceae bacterium]